MASQSPLAVIEQTLKEEKFATRLLEKDNERPFDLLFAGIGEDEKKRGYTVQLHFVNDVTNAVGGADEPEDAYLLQFFLVFPYLIEASKKAEVARAMLAINRILPIGAFGMSEQEGTPYYQYNLACADRSVDGTVLLEILSIMGFFTSEFSPKFEAISEGTDTFDSLIEALSKGGIVFPPITPPKV
ncbi:MAG TPA: hypothetical protein DIU37_02630 [Opitutae bacterium]|nr:hypothetical protein [Opitutae bacterium]|tara:strand:- start:969 stop:1526 length:558 start_codon:yes stop_codon:yes gene_type:complete